MNNLYKRIVIKVGSNVLTTSDGHLNLGIMQNLVSQIAYLRQKQVELILVTSGATATGRSVHSPKNLRDDISRRQVFASIGQVKLISKYNELLEEYGLTLAQVLLTKEDLRDTVHIKNMRRCIQALLQENLIPIINENDVVALAKYMFTDNDELSGLLANILQADALFILTNVDGIFTGSPTSKNSKLLRELDPDIDDISAYIQEENSSLGRGGMKNKAETAYRTARQGITVHIVNGQSNNIVLNIYNGEEAGTMVKALA